MAGLSDPPLNDSERKAGIAGRISGILTLLGYGEDGPGLTDTPQRVARFLWDFRAPDGPEPPFRFTTFDANGTDEMVLMQRIPFSSLCEHHMLPMLGSASVAYIPNGKICGLSKLPRLVGWLSRKLSTQEYLCNEVADRLMELLQPHGVGVHMQAEHLCMSIRGVRTPGTITRTTALRGCFKDASVKSEFLACVETGV